jgi:hypothetical protein
MTNSLGYAEGLPDRADFALIHCATPMRFRSTLVMAAGKPGQESETTTARYTCDGCAATLELVLTEPDMATTT